MVTIQSCFRMFKVRHKFNALRKTVVKIQRNWKKYYYDKQFALKYTEGHFNKNEDEESIKSEKEYWSSLLFRDLGQSSKGKERGMERILFQNDKIKQDKISLFYYLLDFQILAPLGNVYPEYSWVENYISLYEQTWQKGNPIQSVQVSDEHTICATLNKVYTWGDYCLDDFISPSSDRFKTIRPLAVPQGRLEKAHAHNKFTVVEL